MSESKQSKEKIELPIRRLEKHPKYPNKSFSMRWEVHSRLKNYAKATKVSMNEVLANALDLFLFYHGECIFEWEQKDHERFMRELHKKTTQK